MSGCANCSSGAGPMAKGRELVEFVYQAHDGALRYRPIPQGGLKTSCQRCDEEFILTTFIGCCPYCSGVHAVSPPCADDTSNIQYAGDDFCFPEG